MITRVYQLADEFGLSKFELIDAINSLELDISVDNAMSALSDEDVAQLKQALKLETFDPQPVLGVWRLESLTRGKSRVRTEQSHLVIQEDRLWTVRPSFADFISKHPDYEYRLEWKDDIGQLTVSRAGEETYRGLLQVDSGELRIRWAKDGGDFRRALKSGFPRAMGSGGSLAVYEREESSEVSEGLLAGELLPEAWELTYEGIELCDEGRHEEALDLFDRALEFDPRLALAYHQRGVAQMERGEFSEALTDLDRALEVDENLVGARQSRAQCLQDLGQVEQAAQDRLRLARAGTVDEYVATTELAASSKRGDVNVSPRTWADCAETFSKADRTDKAVEVLEEYLADYEPKVTAEEHDKPVPLRLLAQLRLDAGDVDEARELAETAYAHENRSPTETFILACALEAAGELDEAREKLAEMPDYEGKWEELAALRERLAE